MKNTINEIINDSINVKYLTIKHCIESINVSAKNIINRIQENKKILICGNGGSASDAQHFAAELVVRYKNDRKSLPAISLVADTSIITACSNDYNFSDIFSRQISSLGSKGDILVAISTSGNSLNVNNAIISANNKGMDVICLTGNDGGKIAKLGIGEIIIVPSKNTARIQESHIMILHIFCELLDQQLIN
tara:strand:+ start:258 stop:830 length:573 start_codon:yes stop_codon:yes gene_type:complete